MFNGKVRYWCLGRNKSEGEFVVKCQTEEQFNNKMLQEFSKYLISKDILFEDGKIFAGFRNVGNFQFFTFEENKGVN